MSRTEITKWQTFQHMLVECVAGRLTLSLQEHTKVLYPDCSLAGLYDEDTMPPELRKAHQQNDLAVMQAYSFPKNITESECVAELMKLYQKLTTKSK